MLTESIFFIFDISLKNVIQGLCSVQQRTSKLTMLGF